MEEVQVVNVETSGDNLQSLNDPKHGLVSKRILQKRARTANRTTSVKQTAVGPITTKHLAGGVIFVGRIERGKGPLNG